MEGYQLTEEDSAIINYLKAIFAVMVVFIHARYHGVSLSTGVSVFREPGWLYWMKETLSGTIPDCAVPGFFLIAGVLLFRKSFKWRENLRKKTRTLLVPYLLAQFFWIIFYAVIQQIPGTAVYFSDPHKLVANWGDCPKTSVSLLTE